MIIDDNYFPVSETFVSIQGEGPYTGMNSFFIRFQFCNYKCKWCDTKYTWITNANEYNVYTFEELKTLISGISIKNIILTGGEPLMYRIDKLCDDKHKFFVETNGSISPFEKFNIQLNNNIFIKREKFNESKIKKFIWIVSPKLSNANIDYDFVKINLWKKIPNVFFKFIIENEIDLKIVDDLVKQFNIDKNKIYIGLEGSTIESQLKPLLVDMIIGKGYNYSPRLHILLWKNKRGK